VARNLPVTPTLLLFRGAEVIICSLAVLDDGLSAKETKCAHAVSQTLALRKSALFQLISTRGRAQLFHFCWGGEIFLRDSSFLFVDGNFFLLSLV
jgi:hypothetical protein